MVQIPGVTDHQLCRNILRAEHRRHDSRIVKADAFFGGKDLVYIGQIAGLYRLRLRRVIGKIVHHIIIYLCHDPNLICRLRSHLRAGLHDRAARIKVHILVGVQKRQVLV